jgi:hypothetical protein
MNPHACTKYAGRLLMALAAITSILLMAACGSGSSFTPPNQVGFTNGSLNGTYVFSSAGSDTNLAPLALAGAFTANGSGGISGGTMDVVDEEVAPMSPVAQAISSSSSYSVGTDGRGQAKLISPYGTFILDFVLMSSSHGLVTEYDGNGTGSGTLDLQTAITSLSQLAGPYAFTLAGADTGSAPFASAGAFTLNAGGTTTTAGVEDFNDGGVPELQESLSGATTLGSGTGPEAIVLTTESHVLDFDFYPIDATHWKLIETDYSNFLSGDAFTQTGASIPTGEMVFTMAGGTQSTGSIANGGVMNSTDGLGDFSSGFEDINDDGTAVTQVPFSGNLDAGESGPTGGRVFVNLSGFSPASSWVIYPSSGGLLMLEADSATVTLGTAYAQSATSFTSPGDYGLNLSGANGGGEVDDIAQFDVTTDVSPAININGILDENVGGSQDSGGMSGTYTPGSPNAFVVTASNSYIGGLTLAYYVVDSSTAIFVDLDPSTSGFPQVAIGTFEAQSTPGNNVVQQARTSMVHPTVRPHTAMRRK